MPAGKPYKPKKPKPRATGSKLVGGRKRAGGSGGIKITEDHPLWNSRTMGNKRRGQR